MLTAGFTFFMLTAGQNVKPAVNINNVKPAFKGKLRKKNIFLYVFPDV
jgi:hypothetical protein